MGLLAGGDYRGQLHFDLTTGITVERTMKKYALALAVLAGLSLSTLLASNGPAHSQAVVLCYDVARQSG